MIDFDEIRKDHKRWQEFAKHTFVNGIDIADLKSGMKVTVSPNLRTGDRSYTDCVWQVIAVNSGHVQAKLLAGHTYSKGPRIFLGHEHHFYSAEDFETSHEGADADA